MKRMITLLYCVAGFSFVVGMNHLDHLLSTSPKIICAWKKSPLATKSDKLIFEAKSHNLFEKEDLHVSRDESLLVFVGWDKKRNAYQQVYDLKEKKILKNKENQIDENKSYYKYQLIRVLDPEEPLNLGFFHISYTKYKYKYDLYSSGSMKITSTPIESFAKENKIIFQHQSSLELSNQIPGYSDLTGGDLDQVLVLRDIETTDGVSVLALFSLKPLLLIRIVGPYNKEKHLVTINDDLTYIYVYDKSNGVLTKIEPVKPGLAINSKFNRLSNIYFETAK